MQSCCGESTLGSAIERENSSDRSAEMKFTGGSTHPASTYGVTMRSAHADNALDEPSPVAGAAPGTEYLGGVRRWGDKIVFDVL